MREQVTSAWAAYGEDKSVLGDLLETHPPSMVLGELLKAVGLIIDQLQLDLRGTQTRQQEQEVSCMHHVCIGKGKRRLHYRTPVSVTEQWPCNQNP